jgi:hypothetical protein
MKQHYTAPITRNAPTAFVFLLDQSGSMAEQTVYDGATQTKAQALATVTNSLLDELIDRCRRTTGLGDYYHIAVLGYSGNGVRDLLGDSGFVVPSELALRNLPTQTTLRERTRPDGTTIVTTTTNNRWVEPEAVGMTPMYEALSRAYNMVEQFCSSEQFRQSYPPTIFNITDGEATDATDAQLRGLAERIKSLATLDGGVQLVNVNLAKSDKQQSVLFPSAVEELPDERYARLLYDMSSQMPERCTPDIMRIRTEAKGGTFRAMSLNTTISDVVAMLNIGTISLWV